MASAGDNVSILARSPIEGVYKQTSQKDAQGRKKAVSEDVYAKLSFKDGKGSQGHATAEALCVIPFTYKFEKVKGLRGLLFTKMTRVNGTPEENYDAGCPTTPEFTPEATVVTELRNTLIKKTLVVQKFDSKGARAGMTYWEQIKAGDKIKNLSTDLSPMTFEQEAAEYFEQN